MKLTLAAARVNKGLTQVEAAKKLGFSHYALTSYEKGRTSPTFEKAKRMAELYEVELDNLIFFRK